jgi:hypothetical protein
MRPQGDPSTFTIGQTVRYRPGVGTYGYEDVPRDSSGRILATVVGHTRTRVRIEFRMLEFGFTKRAVDAASLE